MNCLKKSHQLIKDKKLNRRHFMKIKKLELKITSQLLTAGIVI